MTARPGGGSGGVTGAVIDGREAAGELCHLLARELHLEHGDAWGHSDHSTVDAFMGQAGPVPSLIRIGE